MKASDANIEWTLMLTANAVRKDVDAAKDKLQYGVCLPGEREHLETFVTNGTLFIEAVERGDRIPGMELLS